MPPRTSAMFRPGVALATLLVAVTVTPPGAYGANCLAYLAADAALERDKIPHVQARNRAKQDAKARYRRAVSAAEVVYQNERKEAKRFRKRKYNDIDRQYEKTMKEAYAIYDKSVPPGICRGVLPGGGATFCNPIGKGVAVENRARRKYYQARRRANTAREKDKKQPDKVYRLTLWVAKRNLSQERNQARATLDSTKFPSPSLDKLKQVRDDAYISAYANPGTYSRKVSRYERAVVLKAAAHERKRHCPRW